MQKLVFEGHSDDTFGEYESFHDDYDCCASGALIVWQVEALDGSGLNVVGQYGGRDWPGECPGCWLIGVQQMEEDTPLPDWPMRFETSDSGYSPRLIIEVPDEITLRCLNRDR